MSLASAAIVIPIFYFFIFFPLQDVDPAAVTSSLSNDGVLCLKAPKMALESPKERTIPITHETDQAAKPVEA